MNEISAPLPQYTHRPGPTWDEAEACSIRYMEDSEGSHQEQISRFATDLGLRHDMQASDVQDLSLMLPRGSKRFHKA